MKSVAIVIFPGVQSLDVAGPLDVFAEANRFVPAASSYRIVTIGTAPFPIMASNGMPLGAEFAIEDAPYAFDVVLVPGGPLLPETAALPAITAWLRKAVPLAGRYGSICTGAFILGHAGLLDGKQAATHWSHAHQLSEQFPLARVEPDRIYVRDGRLMTSAGVTAGIDMALALVSEDHGAAVALLVAKRLLVVVQRQGGQSQFSPYLIAPDDDSSPVAKIQRYVMEHIAEPFSVERLAEVVAMSPRSFARIFARDAKVTPAEFVQRARIDAARHLLEGSQLAIKAVAYHCGFGSASRMRLIFSQRLGVTPTQYRERFQQHA
ncbi:MULTISPECIES: GlxA family transcriptional regulator [unclassified Pseudomonas]|uniref:GlxA family transcriptional regulator n=1 Tax=unclassified Pseudomonas TaxID=196821 RepID=UPI002AC95AF5|nr:MULTISPECIES: GlxA family transcriptional regulator [unclassified Pseudomonas]MEB0040449.1 GlxA family transcriptional regulator [Pseudomonas sp. MH10]MEB0078802.1 GlxA family transcriptional regulator [Pseudomonas sp. MH10out]MEB0089707.1 GlxA family transcriptional regulator [Pseudomonas sp. CCI4.2]MEB0103574.1 GlxA family transcriptional regulator [Pseudomonas sp. CCI3.2]MEB0121297.1 GlxA family transcriptional regulator [Pseudomonas sp. CCI1.2]